MREQGDPSRVDRLALDPARQPGDDGSAEIVRGRQQFDEADPAAFLIDQRDIGKRAADIDADPPRHAASLFSTTPVRLISSGRTVKAKRAGSYREGKNWHRW